MKRKKALIIFCMLLGITACGNQMENQNSQQNVAKEDILNSESSEKGAYMTITAEEAKEIMDEETGYVIVDVREESEYKEGHVKGAVLLPLGQIADEAESTLSDKKQTILIYCRSGRRSHMAAEQLTELGYTNIKDFGGIIDWPYDVE